MPKLNPNRPIIEQFYRMPIRDLMLGCTDQPTEQVIGPTRLKTWTTADNNGWIEAGNKRWRVHYYPRSRWNNAWDEYCAIYMITGRNGKRHRYLLISPDGSYIGTQSDLDAHYQSSHTFSPNRVIKKRRQILDELGLTKIVPLT